MKFTKQLVATALFACFASATKAQTQELSSYQFMEIQGGGQLMSTDENKFSPALGMSYGLMSPVIGGRLHISGWQAEGGAASFQKWNYLLTDLDLMLNMTNILSKNNNHPLNIFLVGGFGLATTWNRDGRASYSVEHSLSHSLRGGLRLETDITKPLGLSLEVDANNMSHHFTGRAANTSNWGITAMLGVSYRFGKKYTTKTVTPAPVENVQLTRYQMMTGMLNEQMGVWAKRMANESLEEYQLRVNDETRAAETRKRTYDISTQMAENLLAASDVTLGGYNPVLKKLALRAQQMPDFFLNVEEGEVPLFYKNEDKLKLKNKKYTLNPDDSFELVYVEVDLPKEVTNKTYVFDNLKHESLAYIEEDANFIGSATIRKTLMEETALQGITDDIISLAKKDNVISDKTHIFINANAEPAKDASGKRVLNYNVDFTYEVEESFTARDDFKSGRYQTNESPAAMLMLKVMKQAFEKDFAKYLAEGKRVKIKITGTADASPISRALPYNGQYGEYDKKPIYINKEKGNITLNKKEGIATNEQLAFARALGVQYYIEKEIPALSKTNHEYEFYIEVAKEKGSQFRRINVQYVFEDAF